MSNIVDLEKYRSKKLGKKLKDDAHELLALLDSFMLNGEPIVISVEDSDLSSIRYTLDELYDLSDSNPYEK